MKTVLTWVYSNIKVSVKFYITKSSAYIFYYVKLINKLIKFLKKPMF